MARGWESKAVESQIESAASDTKPHSPEDLDPVHIELIREKENLLLSRTRVCRDLAASQNPRYQEVLRKALKDLNARLSELDQQFHVVAAS
ncbi:MAG TPA: hypothetical protein VG672_14720 [Bryobacteraceae bacterium]|jgi:hypothetical protein|nr:hypothetical protein [Bryobacteraceae bacterium]